MKVCSTGEATDDASASEADDEPVFRPLRRSNWTAFRKRGRRTTPNQSAQSSDGEVNLGCSHPPSDGSYENERNSAANVGRRREADDDGPPSYASALLVTSEPFDHSCACCPVAPPCGDHGNHGVPLGAPPDPPESPDEREVNVDDAGPCVSASSSVAGRPGPGIRAATLARHRSDVVAGATRLEPGSVHHEVLPDILNAHLPPPYATLPPPSSSARRHLPPPPRLRPPRCVVDTEVVEPKHCCGVLVTQTVSIRWFIVMIAFVGLCCAIVGTVLGALKATGREHLTVSLLMIGEWPPPPASLLFQLMRPSTTTDATRVDFGHCSAVLLAKRGKRNSASECLCCDQLRNARWACLRASSFRIDTTAVPHS
ncbi:hypothetical protein HPB48_000108 [Haemaphysalis longicornis]|uniref:Uncharacterized protein n=1 Tax=Haemaphysalis longicornis TaxID=44386 RepID=A0A9J6FQ95_HAELO|nr:hypothetical protein HPB48_000108 [Haemaphysalis longicornis]